MKKNNLTFSKTESRRFGLRIYRETIEEIEINSIFHKILENDIDLLILRLPVEKIAQIYKLNELNFPYFICDSLLYFSCNLMKYSPQLLKNDDLTFSICKDKDKDIINQLVSKIFQGYKNHYSSNPYLIKSGLIQGYQEWTHSFIENSDEGKVCLLIKKSGIPAAFATVSYSEIDNIGEGVLYGGLPEFSGQGMYTDIIRYTQMFLKKKNLKKMLVSTQINNLIVQRAWNNENFKLEKSFYTIHINCFWNKLKDGNIEYITKNPLHFMHLKEYREKIPSSRILNQNLRLLINIEENMEYLIKFSVPIHFPDEDLMKTYIVKIESMNDHRLFAYYTIYCE